MTSRSEALVQRLTSPEVLTFLAVGGVGYVVDVATFNLLRGTVALGSTTDPSYARVLAVAAAMVVTYLGNRIYTWRDQASGDRRREIGLFILFNLVGLGISVVTLVLSHDVLGLTSRLADNISANVVGLALGTLFRYWSYRRFVFATPVDVPQQRLPSSATWLPLEDYRVQVRVGARTNPVRHDGRPR